MKKNKDTKYFKKISALIIPLLLSCSYTDLATVQINRIPEIHFGKKLYVICDGEEFIRVISKSSESFTFSTKFEDDSAWYLDCSDDKEKAQDPIEDEPSTATSVTHISILLDMDYNGVISSGDKRYETKATVNKGETIHLDYGHLNPYW